MLACTRAGKGIPTCLLFARTGQRENQPITVNIEIAATATVTPFVPMI